ncbi:MAG: hypothetical protein AVDCRST_MAG75-2117, partial [uncultured Propionibacteriaceae bacterium]
DGSAVGVGGRGNRHFRPRQPLGGPRRHAVALEEILGLMDGFGHLEDGL